jgi:amino acid efflux transporter
VFFSLMGQETVLPRTAESALTAASSEPTHGSLGLVQATALYVGAVLGTGVLVLPAIAAEQAGPASLIAWAALVALSVPMSLAYAAMSRQRPDAGGFSDAIERAFGPLWGAASGWIFLASVPTGYVVGSLIAGSSAATAFGLDRNAAFAFAAVLLVIVFSINWFGLRVSATFQSISVAVISAVVLLVIVRALPSVRPAEFEPFLPHGVASVGTAALSLFWAFVGWEAITPLANEIRRPRDLWRASIIAVVVVGVFYIGLGFVTVGTHAYGEVGTNVPLIGLAKSTFGDFAGVAMGIAAVALSFPVINAYTAGISRLTAALAERRALPSWLAVKAPGGVPRRALVTMTLLICVALVVSYLAGWGVDDLLPLSASSFIATYVLSMAAATRLLHGAARIGAAVALVACTVVLLFSGALLAWIVGVTIASVLYTRSRLASPTPAPAA